MQNLTDIAYMKSVLSRHGFTFSKALGQNRSEERRVGKECRL